MQRFTRGQRRSDQYSNLFEDKPLLLSDSISSESASENSFGSCDEVDSYVNASISGLLSEEDTSSHFLNDPAFARSPISDSLPRFTVNTTRTRALLGAQPVVQKRKNNDVECLESKTPPLTPNSSEITFRQGSVYSNRKSQNNDVSVVQPETPQRPGKINEQLNIPPHLISHSVRLHRSPPSAISGDISSPSTDSSSSEQALRANDTTHPYDKSRRSKDNSKAANEVEIWKQILMNRVNRFGPNSLEIARGLNELGAAHIRNKV